MDLRPNYRILPFAVAALALAPAAAHAQPGAQDSTRSAQGVRAFLSVKQWFIDYQVELDCSSTRADTRFRSLVTGVVGLDMRNQGPVLFMKPSASPLSEAEQRRAMQNPGSLTPAQLQALANQSAGYLRQIDDTANWMRGPDTMPEVQDPDDPKWQHWLDSTGVDQTVEFHTMSDAFQEQAHGSGRVIAVGNYAFEVDVAQKKYAVQIPVIYGDTKRTLHAVQGTSKRRDLPDGAWETRPIEEGLDAGRFPTFRSITPEPWNTGNAFALEGPLPTQVGAVSGQQVFRVEPYSFDSGTLTIRYTVSPNPPQPVELVIEKPDKYAEWRPLGMDDEETMGNSIAVTAKLQKPGGGDPPFKARRIAFKLLNTSRVPGVCMNYPRLPMNPPPFDLGFEHTRNPDLILDSDGQGAALTTGDGKEATVVVSSFDFGGHAGLQATAELENGDVIVGVVEGTSGERSLKLPSRPADSHVADVFLDRYHVAGEEDDSDVDDEPQGDNFPGDGLTLYEEYRGFMWDPLESTCRHASLSIL